MDERFQLRQVRGWFIVGRYVYDDELEMWTWANDLGKFPTREDARLYMVGRQSAASATTEPRDE